MSGIFFPYRIWNDGQLRAIGTGQRIVRASVGRKWVRVAEPHRLRTKRVSREAWDTVKPERIPTTNGD